MANDRANKRDRGQWVERIVRINGREFSSSQWMSFPSMPDEERREENKMPDNVLAPQITVEVYGTGYRVSYLGVFFVWTEPQIDDVIHFLMMARECQHNKTFFVMPAGEQIFYDEETDTSAPVRTVDLVDVTKKMDSTGLTAMFLEFQRVTAIHSRLFTDIYKLLRNEIVPGETIENCIERLVEEVGEKKKQ